MNAVHNPFVILPTTPQFPCATCKCECCGGVPIFKAELKEVLAYLRSLPASEIKRLASQDREPMMQCKMKCDYAPQHAVQSQIIADSELAELVKDNGRPVITAHNPVSSPENHILKWKELLAIL